MPNVFFFVSYMFDDDGGLRREDARSAGLTLVKETRTNGTLRESEKVFFFKKYVSEGRTRGSRLLGAFFFFLLFWPTRGT